MVSVDQIRTAISRTDVRIDLDKISDNQLFADMGLDSLDTYSIFLEIEKQFNISIPDEEIENLQSIEKIYHYLNKTN